MTATAFVVSAASGSGKTSMVKALLEKCRGLRLSVSFTTRTPRPGEVNGEDYNFVSQEDFQQRLQQGEFLEHAQVFDNYYGTSQIWVEQQLHRGTDVILEIDWQGAQQARKQLPQVVSIFILPPSIEELEKRLRARQTDSDAVIQRRMRDAQAEMSHYAEFDYLIFNDDFATAEKELESIVLSQRLKLARQQQQHEAILQSLLQSRP